MVVEASALQSSTPLRRRMGVLARAHSSNTAEIPASKSSPTMSNHANETHSSFEESESDSSDEREFVEEPKIHQAPSLPRPRSLSNQSEPPSAASNAWYQFDLAVLAAIISPVGSWLMGGDAVRNVLFILFLIFYLRQIIEVPWTLYNSARPRRRSLDHSGDSAADERTVRLASSELHKFEFFFLALTVLSPFLGAVLIHYVTQLVTGEDKISWFSTSLFVLAAGVRPWSHLVSRMTDRVTDLHDVIHYPTPGAESSEALRTELDALRKQVEGFERALHKTRQKMMHTTEEVYEYVDEAIDSLEKSVKRHEKKHEKQELHIREVESALDGLRKSGRPNLGINSSFTGLFQSHPPPPKHSPKTAGRPPSYLHTIPEEKGVPDMPVISRIILRLNYIITLPLRTLARMVLNLV
ncbi:hypothetical protein C8J56DRAFT_823515 [Mycena floridula]|nr:hypothetical protein C8J56DRAFT_823515 [Mycena floridula]